MAFDPTEVPDDSSRGGHLDDTPIYELLLSILQTVTTGRMTIGGPSGDNHMYFMQGRPVGVQLADYFHPLGQLLLELGRIDAHTFIKAQRLISEGNRLPGQVFMGIGVLDDEGLKDVLAIQASRKAEEFCRLGGREFSFGRGLTFLSGFQSTPLDVHAVLFIAVRQQMGPASRTNWLDELMNKEVRIDEGGDLLPSSLDVYGFGPPEERFLRRLQSGWQSTRSLAETGSLPNDEMAVLLRYLHVIDRVRVREPAPAPKPEAAPVNAFSPVNAFAPAAVGAPPRKRRAPERVHDDLHRRPRSGQEDVITKPITKPVTNEQTPKSPGPMPQGASESIVVAPDLLEPPKKKKKKRRRRRTEALPSVGEAAESHTRKEKTNIGPLPSIVIEPGD